MQISLPLFEREQAEALLTGLATKEGGCFAPDVLAFLLELAGQHPLLLQIAGFHAFACEELAHGSPLDETKRDQVFRAFDDETKEHWRSVWKTIGEQAATGVQDQRYLVLFAVEPRADSWAIKRLKAANAIIEHEGNLRLISPAFQHFVNRQHVPGLIQAPPIIIDPHHIMENGDLLVVCRNKPIKLTHLAYKFLKLLTERAGYVVPYKDIIDELWGDNDYKKERLKPVRKEVVDKLGEDGCRITPSAGQGYMFRPDPS